MLDVSCRETWGWSERVDLYNRQIMVTTEKGKRVKNTVWVNAGLL